MKTQMSKEGKERLSEWEGVELNVYRDVADLPTIGVGHLLTRDELTSGKIFIRGELIKYADGLTRKQVIDLLGQDLRRFEEVINERVKVDLKQTQFDALVSFSFNVGGSAFRNSERGDAVKKFS